MKKTVHTAVDADPVLANRVRARLGLGETHALAVLEGGRSGLTYTIGAGSDRAVVKAVPAGRRAVGRNDVLHHAAILEALADTAVPAPAALARATAQPAGFAMEFAAAQAAEPVLEVDAAVEPALARARMLEAARILGALHAVPLAVVERSLADTGGTLPEAVTADGEVDRWATTMNAVPED